MTVETPDRRQTAPKFFAFLALSIVIFSAAAFFAGGVLPWNMVVVALVWAAIHIGIFVYYNRGKDFRTKLGLVGIIIGATFVPRYLDTVTEVMWTIQFLCIFSSLAFSFQIYCIFSEKQ